MGAIKNELKKKNASETIMTVSEAALQEIKLSPKKSKSSIQQPFQQGY